MKRLALIAALLVSLLPESQAAIKIAPKPKRESGVVLKESQEAFERRDFDGAIKLLTEAIDGNPQLAPALVLRGFAYAAKEDYAKAIEDYSAALKLEPNDDRPLIFRAATYQAMKEFKKAIEDYTKLIERKPDDIEPLCSRGLCYAQSGEEKKAFEDFDKAVSIAPKSAVARQLRGSAHADAGRKTEALTDFKEAINIDPNNPATYLYRAHLYLVEDQPEDALADFEEVMRRAPGFSGASNDYAWTLATNPNDKVRDGRKAVKYAKDACHETDYKHAPTVDTLAAAYAEAGEWEEAVKWQEEAAKLAEKTHPKDVEGMKKRLLLYKEKRPYRENPKEENERRKSEKP
jgi:tetratricopeptide (TPR) repeat protein